MRLTEDRTTTDRVLHQTSSSAKRLTHTRGICMFAVKSSPCYFPTMPPCRLALICTALCCVRAGEERDTWRLMARVSDTPAEERRLPLPPTTPPPPPPSVTTKLETRISPQTGISAGAKHKQTSTQTLRWVEFHRRWTERSRMHTHTHTNLHTCACAPPSAITSGSLLTCVLGDELAGAEPHVYV